MLIVAATRVIAAALDHTDRFVMHGAMASRSAPSPKPRRGDARRALLDAAHRLVRKHGWAATSVDQLCTEAGVTKGAFFHHFASKEDLGVAAAQHWSDVSGPIFADAPYNCLADPLARVFAYLDFRADIADGPLEAFTCFAGTMVQEVFASSDPLRVACGTTIQGHIDRLSADFEAALAAYPPRASVTAASLARYTQTVLQGGFVLSKAEGGREPLLDAIAHLKRYLALLFGKEPSA
jgi:TetR/AcrR family transcriptional regulator, transcriptional repressor for nem operon